MYEKAMDLWVQRLEEVEGSGGENGTGDGGKEKRGERGRWVGRREEKREGGLEKGEEEKERRSGGGGAVWALNPHRRVGAGGQQAG